LIYSSSVFHQLKQQACIVSHMLICYPIHSLKLW